MAAIFSGLIVFIFFMMMSYDHHELMVNQVFVQQFVQTDNRSAFLSLCEGNPPVTGSFSIVGFPAQRDWNTENVSI